MPIVNADAAGLEWRGIIELSRDDVALAEILENRDFHAENQKRFNLPDRRIAKFFLFRWIFLGTAGAFANDPNFSSVGDKTFWQNVIDEANEKYFKIAQYHRDAVSTTMINNGKYISPVTGRIYQHQMYERRGQMDYNVNNIVNYPVQGFGSDLMALARTEIHRRATESGLIDNTVFPILTVHDSVMYDCHYGLTDRSKPWYNISSIIVDVFKEIPYLWKSKYGSDLFCPHDCEVQVGVNWGNLHTIYKQGWLNG